MVTNCIIAYALMGLFTTVACFVGLVVNSTVFQQKDEVFLWLMAMLFSLSLIAGVFWPLSLLFLICLKVAALFVVRNAKKGAKNGLDG